MATGRGWTSALKGLFGSRRVRLPGVGSCSRALTAYELQRAPLPERVLHGCLGAREDQSISHLA